MRLGGRNVFSGAALLAGLLALLLAAGLKLEPGEAHSPLVGQAAPEFNLPHLNEPSRTLRPADMKGRVWLLNVWASWCAPCRDEHPWLVTLAREQAVPIVGLNHRDDPRNAQEWLIRLGDPYQASLIDRDGRVGAAYGVLGVPETLLIDPNGIVRLKHSGPLTPEVWARRFQPLIRTDSALPPAPR
jgi:cytochrome c biogenesis protein CcmG, thiol:disulfide interchange protein DsbE